MSLTEWNALQVQSMCILQITSVLSFCSWLILFRQPHQTGEMRTGFSDSPSMCWFATCFTEKLWDGDRKSSNWNTNWFYRRNTKQRQRWILTSDFPLAIQNRQGIVSHTGWSSLQFHGFCSLGQNIGRSFFRSCNYYTLCLQGMKDPRNFNTGNCEFKNSQTLGSAFRFLPATRNWSILFKNTEINPVIPSVFLSKF